MAIKKTITDKGVAAALQSVAEKATTALGPTTTVEVVKKQAVAEIMVKNPDGTEVTTEELVGQPAYFATPPVTVGMGAKLKINMGNYSSAEVSVFLSVPCAPADLNETANFIETWVDGRISTAADKMNAMKVA